MKAVIKMLKTKVPYTDKKTGEVTLDFQGIYQITDATEEELQRYKDLKGIHFREDDVTRQPLYYNRGIAPTEIEVVISTNKQGEDYEFVGKDLQKEYLLSKINEASNALNVNPDDRNAQRAFDRASDKLEEYDMQLLSELQKATANNRNVKPAGKADIEGL